MSAYTLRPLSDRTWLTTDARRSWTPFDSSWTDTLDLLEREVRMLGGKDLVLGVDVHEGQIRLDGTLRARATAETPAVEVAFTSKHGPMLYRCDKYLSRWAKQGPHWQQNVRAIAKTLEALRAVERYGASNSGEQYRGYRQIAATASTTSTDARARLAEITGDDHTLVPLAVIVAHARRAAHPDRGGSDELWHEVQQLTAALEGGPR